MSATNGIFFNNVGDVGTAVVGGLFRGAYAQPRTAKADGLPRWYRCDAGDAVNVARSRLATAMPDTETRDGEPTEELRAAVEDHDPDVVVIGSNRGTADETGVGSTATALRSDLDRPVVVVPLPDL